MNDLRKAHAEHGNNDSLRLAAEMALDVLRNTVGHSSQSQTRIDDAKHALVQALEQPEQEPVAWQDPQYKTLIEPHKAHPNWIPLYTASPSLEAAVVAEREACAKFVDHILREGGGTYGDAIRERNEK